jgi:hypothetical protein
MTNEELQHTIDESGKVAEMCAGEDIKDLKAAGLWMIVKMLGVISQELRRIAR